MNSENQLNIYCVYVLNFLWFQQTLSQWNKVFYLSGAICISSGLIYIFFGTSSVQEWNTYENPDLDEREMKLTHKKSKSDKVSKI